MYDIFSTLGVDKKEDTYTFCLEALLNGSEEFRKRSAKTWGFKENDGNYKAIRRAFTFDDKSRIVPDLILYNDYRIAVIESKMFSSEGYSQTTRYKAAEQKIIEFVREKNKNSNNYSVGYYFFTLPGLSAVDEAFETIKWTDYYSTALDQNRFFDDDYLALLAQEIWYRAKQYTEFKEEIKESNYKSLISNDNSWITPSSLFTAGTLNSIWDMDINEYGIYNGTVQGVGHATYRTDISKKSSWRINPNKEDDNIYLFTRIEWNSDSVDIFLNWEYWRVVDGVREGYIPYSKKSEEMQKISFENRMAWISQEREFVKNNKEGISIPKNSKKMLHMLKASIPVTDDTEIEWLIQEIKKYVSIYEEEANKIVERLKIEDGYYRYR